MGPLSAYFEAAMSHAEFETLPDNEGVFGHIPGLDGLWANAPTVTACRDELKSALEDWVLVGLQLGHEALTAGVPGRRPGVRWSLLVTAAGTASLAFSPLLS